MGRLCRTVVLSVVSFALVANSALAATYYVSPSGNNTLNPGTFNQPFQTITKCASVAVSGDTCRMRAGTYRESVTPASGTTFDRHNGESVTVDGSDPVTGWTVHSGNIYKASVTLQIGSDFKQVFANGSMLTEARYPNSSGDLFAPNWATMGAGTDSTCDQTGSNDNTVTDSSLPAIDWTGATMHIWSGTNPFMHQTATVTSSSSGSVETNFTNEDTCPYSSLKPGGKYYLVGKLAALDTAGEWYYDGSQLYVWAPGGGVPSGITFKQRPTAFNLSNRSNVTISDLNVHASTIGLNASSANNVIEGVTATYISHYEKLPMPTIANGEIVASDGGWDIVASRENSSGIELFGHDNTIRNSEISYSAGNGVRVGGNDNTVENNLISHAGYGGSYATAVSMSGEGHVVRDNTIHTTARDGIVVEFHVAGYQFFDNDISYNHIYNTSLMAPDSGGIYTCCYLDGLGTDVHHNWIHDVADTPVGPPPAGIYLDVSSNWFDVYQNVTWDNVGYGIFVHGDSEVSQGNMVFENTSYGEQDHSIRAASITDGQDTVIGNNQVDRPITLDSVPGNLFAFDNTLSRLGANEGATAAVGCSWTSCAGETPIQSGVLMTYTEPAVTKWGSGGLYLFARRSTNTELRGNTLSGWSSLGGELRSGPGVAAWSSSHADVFVVGEDGSGNNALYQKTYNGSWPGSYTPLSGPSVGVATAPAATSRSSGNIELFVVGNDQAVWRRTYSGGSWSSWTSLGGNAFAQPAVVTTASGDMELFVLGVDDELYTRTWSAASQTWSSWATFTEPPGGATSAPAVTTRGSGTLEVFVRGDDNALWQRSYSGGSWSSWSSLGGEVASGPAATSNGSSNIEVFVRGTDDQIYRKTWNGSSWPAFYTAMGAP